jgi:crotonobetainyl-CoA:carnitine CoA-transferase CaiB-like acyl-CoA transferase
MYATIAICAALAHRERTGAGDYIDMALLDTQAAFLANQAMNYLATGEAPRRIGNAHPNIVPYQTFKTRDGDIILACGNDNLFGKFCEVAGCAELARDGRFATNGRRVENRAELTQLLAALFLKRTTREWVDALEAAGVPNGPINNIAQVFAEPQVVARGMKLEVDHPSAGRVALVGSPMRFAAATLDCRVPPPVLGQHTDEVLRSLLGKTEAELSALRAAGVT